MSKGDANAVRIAFDIVNASRNEFGINAIRFGLCALAAKQIVGYGNFGKWISNALATNGNASVIAERDARDYIGLAKVFVQKLRHPNKLSDALAAGVGEFCDFCNIDRDKFDIEKILADKTQTEDLLRRTLSGMTLPQLRNLLREGAVQAEEDKKAEDTAAKNLTKRDLKGLSGNGGGQSAQMLLWEDWEEKCESVDMLLADNRSNELLDPEHWLRLENKVSAWLDEIRKITKSLR